MEVRIRKHESPENLIKRFTKKIKRAKIIEEYLENQYYKKPSEKRREKYFQRLATIKKIKRKERQQRDD